MLLFYQYGIKKKHVGFIKKQPTFKLLLICIHNHYSLELAGFQTFHAPALKPA